MRIRRITLSTLTSRHRDQSLLAPAYNPILLSLLASHARPLLHRSHITSFRRLAPEYASQPWARIGYHSRVISAQHRRIVARESRARAMPILTRIRYYRPASGSGPCPVTARWLPLASAFTALSRRIRYYQDNASSRPDPSISIPREAAVSLSLSLRHEICAILSTIGMCGASTSLRNVLYTCIYMYTYIYNTSVCVYRCMLNTWPRANVESTPVSMTATERLGRRDPNIR